jgi:preprotein translocase subunit SecD
MNQARNILSARVNGTGVTQSTVEIQGSNQLVVSIPGQNSQDIQSLGKAAVLNFRGVVIAPVPVTCSTKKNAKPAPLPSASPSASSSSSSGSAPGSGPASSSGTAPASTSPAPSHSGQAAAVRPLNKPKSSGKPKSSTSPSGKASKTPSASSTPSGSTTPSGSSTPTPTPTSTAPAAPTKCSATSVADTAKAAGFKVPLSDTDATSLSSTDTQALQSALTNYNCAAAQTEQDLPNTYYVACDGTEQTKQRYAYLLGPVIVPGKEIDTADALEGNGQNNGFGWSVQLTLKSSGQSSWANYTKAHNVNNDQNSPPVTSCAASSTPCADYVSFTLDGNIISTPVNLSAINGGATQITGNFTQDTATSLADQLKYGALPLSFSTSDVNSVSATLGTQQLKAGLLAGGIGLVLVVLYSLIYYRALGLVTIASLLVSGVLTYGALVMLSTQISFTLSLAGIAGFIVAVGITADSFVVFFERLKDEVHEGRSVRVAVPRAWVRARRTILSADTVSFLAAAVLFYFTTADVRGFAFTLGLSTILDLIVVFLFTHPMVSLLSRSSAFGSARFTGLDALRASGPAPGYEPVRRERPRRTSNAPAEEPPGESKYSGTAVLGRPTAPTAPAEDDVDETPPETTDAPVEPAGEPIDETADEPSDEFPEVAEDADDEAPRRRTAPEPGSAAERAAQRRARMREQRNQPKNPKDGQ